MYNKLLYFYNNFKSRLKSEEKFAEFFYVICSNYISHYQDNNVSGILKMVYIEMMEFIDGSSKNLEMLEFLKKHNKY